LLSTLACIEHKKRIFSPEHRRKLSEAKKGSKHPTFGKISPLKGRKRPDISASLMGKKHTMEYK
jgi:hypothetical protein